MCIYKVFVMQVDRPRAMITGVGVYYPDYILTNEELSRMVDTSDGGESCGAVVGEDGHET